jgi:hypothetical protein
VDTGTPGTPVTPVDPGTPNTPVNTGTPTTSGTGGTVTITTIENEATALATTGFTDVGSVDWAWEAIRYMSENKGIAGVGDGRFDPYGAVTRAQFSRFVAQAFDIGMGDSVPSFTDVPESAWFYEDVSKLASRGLILGYGEGLFGPGDLISREQMASIVKRTMDYLNISVSATREFDLTDLEQASSYARDGITTLYRSGIISGMGNNLFVPKGTANRAQACVIVYQAIKTAGRL